MIIYLLKFSACLLVFIVFYKVFLEKESIHVFKRFYLMFAVVIAFGIPIITFTQYVETTPAILLEIIKGNSIQTNTPFETNYLPTFLWSVYGFGVLVFGILFLKNLIQILFKIKQNAKVKKHHFTNVLLHSFVIPHTFFNYIFVNKHKFETQQIPKEVLLHEETHALQKHSMDVLFIEILQVVFWFNPLIYLIKHSIKLNHEFLADQAVLNKGVNTTTYQNTILAFSSKALQPQLASAINYSLIKKRFTVMKTQTTKKGIWLRSMLLLPMLAILLFSFSSKNIIQVEKDSSVKQELKIIQEKATPKQVTEYNALAKKYNEMPEDNIIIEKNDLERLKYLYNLMAKEQKKNAEPFPNIPPPPAPIAPNAKQPDLPPPPPLPDNATPKQKKKNKEAIENYKIKAKVATRVNKIGAEKEELYKVRKLRNVEERKQFQEGKIAYRRVQIATKANRVKAEKVELVKVRKLRVAEEKKRFQEGKLAYRRVQIATKANRVKAEKGELIKIRKLRVAEERKQFQEGKIVYRKAQVAARANKIKAEKGELVKVRKLRAAEEIKQFQEGKIAYRKAQVAARTNKIKAEKGEFVKVRKLRAAEERKKLKEEKKAYRKSQAEAKALKKKSKKKGN